MKQGGDTNTIEVVDDVRKLMQPSYRHSQAVEWLMWYSISRCM